MNIDISDYSGTTFPNNIWWNWVAAVIQLLPIILHALGFTCLASEGIWVFNIWFILFRLHKYLHRWINKYWHSEKVKQRMWLAMFALYENNFVTAKLHVLLLFYLPLNWTIIVLKCWPSVYHSYCKLDSELEEC